MVGGRRVEPGTRAGGAVDDDGTGACVVEGRTARVVELEVAVIDHGKAGVDIASGEDLVAGADLGEATATGEDAGVSGAGTVTIIRADGEGVRPHRVAPASLNAAEVVGRGASEAEGERAGVVGIEIERGTGEGVGIGEDERAGRDPGGAGEAVARREAHDTRSALDDIASVPDRGGDKQVGGRIGTAGDIERRGIVVQIDAVGAIDHVLGTAQCREGGVPCQDKVTRDSGDRAAAIRREVEARVIIEIDRA